MFCVSIAPKDDSCLTCWENRHTRARAQHYYAVCCMVMSFRLIKLNEIWSVQQCKLTTAGFAILGGWKKVVACGLTAQKREPYGFFLERLPVNREEWSKVYSSGLDTTFQRENKIMEWRRRWAHKCCFRRRSLGIHNKSETWAACTRYSNVWFSPRRVRTSRQQHRGAKGAWPDDPSPPAEI